MSIREIINCKKETKKHINLVNSYMDKFANELIKRGKIHDASKLEEPELSDFAKHTKNLKNLTYGSIEYKNDLKDLQSTLKHHYANNSHHPEHYVNGIAGMNLLDLIELFCDWKASTLRHNDGNIKKSIEINQNRFGYDDILKSILLNTVNFLENK